MCRFNKGGLSKKTYMAKSRSRQKNQFSLKKILRQIKFCRSFFRAHTHAHETHSSKPLIPAASAHRNCTFPCKLRRVSFQQSTSIHLCLNPVKRYKKSRASVNGFVFRAGWFQTNYANKKADHPAGFKSMVARAGIEPATNCLEGNYSIH